MPRKTTNKKTIVCPKCHKEILDSNDIKYCPYCGNSLFPDIYPNINEKKDNGFCVAGFVLSLVGLIFGLYGVVPIVSLILSCIGLSKTKNNPNNGKGLAKAGIIISIVAFIFSIFKIALIVYLFKYLNNYNFDYFYNYNYPFPY